MKDMNGSLLKIWDKVRFQLGTLSGHGTVHYIYQENDLWYCDILLTDSCDGFGGGWSGIYQRRLRYYSIEIVA